MQSFFLGYPESTVGSDPRDPPNGSAWTFARIDRRFVGIGPGSGALGEHIQRARSSSRCDLQYVGVDHRRADIAMPQQLLQRADVRAGLKKMRGEAVAQCVHRHVLGNASCGHGSLERPAQAFFVRHTRQLDRFTLRGKEKVGTQWRLYCLVHNIEKLARNGSR